MPTGRLETVLVVEDTDAVRDIVVTILERNGYTVHAIGYPADALRLAEHEETRMDLLLTDLVMPGLSGHELTTQIRQYRPDIRVLYMSGYHDDAATRDGTRLDKPFSERQLLAAIRATLDDPHHGAPQPDAESEVAVGEWSTD